MPSGGMRVGRSSSEVSDTRLTHWLVGVVLGAVGGGSALIVGVVALLVLIPGLVWPAHESSRPRSTDPGDATIEWL